MSSLKKAGWGYRSFDPTETPRLTLHEALKQVLSSYGVVVHLLSPNREGATVHNGRCAFVAGLAMATNKRVLMLQETNVPQPIDYRDVVVSYTTATKVPELLQPFIRGIAEATQEQSIDIVPIIRTPLEKLDLGDIAAENEIRALSAYFVKTAEYQQAKRGHARLVVGRKGGGKTAIFYGIWHRYRSSRAHLILDLKPEGYQFAKLREFVLSELTPALQQHVLTAFWNYLLLIELAHKIVHEEGAVSYRDSDSRKAYERVEELYGNGGATTEQGDFSERLMKLVDDIVQRKGSMSDIVGTSEITQLVYSHDIHALSNALSDYLVKSGKDGVWLLFDNLDKGWPVKAATQEDILLLQSLLEATWKLQRQMRQREVEFHGIVFIRNDIYQHLLISSSDRGKDTAVLLDWDDPEVFKEIIRRRVIQSTGLNEKFEDVWLRFFESHVNGEESFGYILRHTQMRPREVIRLIRECINVSVNRGHDKVGETDIIQAEQSYSDDAFKDISLELSDVRPNFADAPYAFIGSKSILSKAEVTTRLLQISVNVDEQGRILDLLLWFGFLGIHVYPDEERYSYNFKYDLKRMKSGLPSQFGYSIHPAFRTALGCI